MIFVLGFLSFTALVATAPHVMGSDRPEAPAQSAAFTWLVLVDAGNYAGSWNACSPRLLRAAFPVGPMGNTSSTFTS